MSLLSTSARGFSCRVHRCAIRANLRRAWSQHCANQSPRLERRACRRRNRPGWSAQDLDPTRLLLRLHKANQARAWLAAAQECRPARRRLYAASCRTSGRLCPASRAPL
jgi:hypothetical protein